MSLAHLIVMLIMMGGLFAMTLPVELQEKRWLRLGVSLPVVFVLSSFANFDASQGRMSVVFIILVLVFCLMLLAVIWREHLTHFPAKKVMNVLYGDGRGGGGFRLDLRHSHTLIKEGRFEEARKEIIGELEKSHADYEGRLLLASLDCHLKNPKAAMQSIDILKRSPWLTSEQHDEVNRAAQEVVHLQIKLDDERQRSNS